MTRRAWRWLRDSTWALLAVVVLLAGGVLTWLPIPWATLANRLGHSLAIWGIFRGPGLATLLGTVLLAMIVVARMLTWRRQRHSAEKRRPAVRPLRWWWVVLIALVIAGVVALALWWLMGLAEQSLPKDEPKARIDAVRTALTLGAGLVGVVALVLTSRKQWLAEHTQRHTESDAAEQRATELYTAAAEQLASDKAPVRLAGLYALSRLGQHNPTYRQTIVDLWCAYLRMPYTPPGVESLQENNSDLPDQDKIEQNSNNQPLLLDLAPTLAEAAGLSLDGADKHQQEHQVRLTAQRLLVQHLRPDPDENGQHTNPDFWEGYEGTGFDLDLASATLNYWDFSDCHVRRAKFNDAHFHGYAWFSKAHFHGFTDFGGAQFHDASWFDQAQFHKRIRFDVAQFYDLTVFSETHFHHPSQFMGTHFHHLVSFGKTNFHGNTWFNMTQFYGQAWFEEAQFNHRIQFSEAQFHHSLWFGAAQFHETVNFEKVWVRLDNEFPIETTLIPKGWTVRTADPGDEREGRWGKLVPVDAKAPDDAEGTAESESAEQEASDE